MWYPGKNRLSGVPYLYKVDSAKNSFHEAQKLSDVYKRQKRPKKVAKKACQMGQDVVLYSSTKRDTKE